MSEDTELSKVIKIEDAVIQSHPGEREAPIRSVCRPCAVAPHATAGEKPLALEKSFASSR